MATSKKFSELTAASSLTANDLAAVAHVDAQAETGYESQKATMSQLGQYLNKEMQYATDLSKFPVGSQSPIPALNNLRDFLYGQLPVNSASGSIANFKTSLALPLVALKAYITAQGGGGTPSVPVAITGFDSVVITQADENMQTVNTFTIQLGQTCYGGYIDKESGKLVITWARYNDLATNISSIAKDSASWRVYYSSEFYGLDNQNKEGLCDKLTFRTTYSAVNNNNYSISFPSSSGNQVLLRNDDLSTSSDVETFLATLDIVYPLAVPIETDITIPDITALVGENNIFADSGDIEVSFKMGVQEYIDKKIAEVQALIL